METGINTGKKKKYNWIEAFRRICSLYKGHGLQLFWATVWFAVKHAPTYVVPIVIANIINIVTSPDGHSINELFLNLTVGAVFVAQNIFTAWLHARAYSGLTRGIEMELRGQMVRKLQRLSIQFHAHTQSGRLLSKVMRDVENVEQMLNSCFGAIVPFFTTILVAIAVTAYNNPQILWLYVMAVPVASFAVGIFKNPIGKSNRQFRNQMERTQAAVSEMLEMVPVTRAYGLNEKEVDKMNLLLVGVRDSGYHLDTTNTVFGATSWVVFQLFQLLCLGVTGFFAYRGLISAGEVVLYQNYFGQIVAAVSGIVNLFPALARGMESLNSIDEIMSAEDDESSGAVPAPVPLRGEVHFEHVYYRYPDADVPVLNDFDLAVPGGTKVAFVGPSGSGKSTVLSLILGFIQPDQGRVTVDGIDLCNMDLKRYRSQIAVVPQNTILFSGTLRDNIAYAAPDATDEEIMRVIDEIGLRDLVEKLPGGLNGNLSEHGGNFSGGQRQRIAIARALIRHPRLIILDEATSALDSQSEKMVSRATEHLMEQSTVFMVAHRLSTIKSADLIVVVDQGRIVEQGSYEELMAKKGRFYELKILQK